MKPYWKRMNPTTIKSVSIHYPMKAPKFFEIIEGQQHGSVRVRNG